MNVFWRRQTMNLLEKFLRWCSTLGSLLRTACPVPDNLWGEPGGQDQVNMVEMENDLKDEK